jgi:hypothetical protein
MTRSARPRMLAPRSAFVSQSGSDFLSINSPRTVAARSGTMAGREPKRRTQMPIRWESTYNRRRAHPQAPRLAQSVAHLPHIRSRALLGLRTTPRTDRTAKHNGSY